MALRTQVPKFGDWENKDDVPYTVYFEKAKKNRNPKKPPQIYDPSFNDQTSFPAREEAEIKYGESVKSEPQKPKDQDPPETKQKSHVSQEEVDLRKSTDSPTRPKSRQSVASDQGFETSQMHPHHQEKVRNRGSTVSSMWEEVDLRKSADSPAHTKRISRQSVGSDQSFDSSPLHPPQQERVRNKVTTSSLWERKVLSEGSHGSPASSTPGRSRLRQVTLDENADESPAIPKFGDWDDNDPRSGERYTQVFNKAREDKQAAGGKSPIITIENADFYGHRDENVKGCGCFPWGRK